MPRPRTDTPSFTIAERGGRFYVRWWENGKAQRLSLRTGDRETAKRRLAAFIAGRGTPEPPENPTIGRILDGYAADRRGRIASPATMDYAIAALKDHMAHLSPEALTRERARSYATTRREQGRRGATGKRQPLSNGTIIRELVTLRAALKWAQRERWIAEIPYVEVPPAPKPKDRWLTREEADRLLQAAVSPHLRVFIALALYTAGRTGAILGLTWDRVDLKGRLIDLGDGAGNKRRATVPINATLRAELLRAAEARRTDWVVEYRGGPVQLLRHGFRETAARAGVRNVTPHVLRHTAATWMVQRGVPLPMVAKFLGNGVEMIEKVYGHHSPDWLRQAADALDGVS